MLKACKKITHIKEDFLQLKDHLKAGYITGKMPYYEDV